MMIDIFPSTASCQFATDILYDPCSTDIRDIEIMHGLKRVALITCCTRHAAAVKKLFPSFGLSDKV